MINNQKRSNDTGRKVFDDIEEFIIEYKFNGLKSFKNRVTIMFQI